jgi:hypothetical protein
VDEEDGIGTLNLAANFLRKSSKLIAEECIHTSWYYG